MFEFFKGERRKQNNEVKKNVTNNCLRNCSKIENYFSWFYIIWNGENNKRNVKKRGTIRIENTI